MADPNIQIPALPAAYTLDGADMYHVRQGATDKKVTYADIRDDILSNVALGNEATKGKLELSTELETVAGNDSTRATHAAGVKALVLALLVENNNKIYPVGSVYTNANSNVNPSTLLGFGTWVPFGVGKVLVGTNAADTTFNTLGATGGSKNAVVVSHTHAMSAGGHHRHSLGAKGVTYRNIGWGYYDQGGGSTQYTEYGGSHTHNIIAAGESGAGKNLQPYIVVSMWKRTD